MANINLFLEKDLKSKFKTEVYSRNLEQSDILRKFITCFNLNPEKCLQFIKEIGS